MHAYFRIAAVAAVTAMAMQLTGCANIKMSPPQAALENTAKLRSANARRGVVQRHYRHHDLVRTERQHRHRRGQTRR